MVRTHRRTTAPGDHSMSVTQMLYSMNFATCTPTQQPFPMQLVSTCSRIIHCFACVILVNGQWCMSHGWSPQRQSVSLYLQEGFAHLQEQPYVKAVMLCDLLIYVMGWMRGQIFATFLLLTTMYIKYQVDRQLVHLFQ